MKAFKYIEKIREYLDYLETHIKNVEKAFGLVKDKCSDMKFIQDDYNYQVLEKEISRHDLSKFSKFEFIQYQNCFYPVDPNVMNVGEFNNAWQHHMDCNSHHWENWAEKRVIGRFDNPWEVDCAHMVIDWIAMSYAFGDTAQDFYEKNEAKIKLPKHAIDFIYEIFKRVYSK